jgi:hypothetical protein
MNVNSFVTGYQTVGRPHGRAMVVLMGAGVVCMRDVLVLNEIWTQDKIHFLVGILLS